MIKEILFRDQTRKWRCVRELILQLEKDDTLGSLCRDVLKCCEHAPNIGSCIWIFKYKGILVSLVDRGNSHYGFHSVATRFDLLIAKIMYVVNRMRG